MISAPDSALVHELRGSPNFGERRNGLRPSILLLHYTGVETAAKAIDWLTTPESQVSCHYVIDEAGVITQMVAEDMRAWHAGAAVWAGETDINSLSIGIEVHNAGHEQGLPDFPEAQVAMLEALCRDIIARHKIEPQGVLAHSDVAPARKIDPGEKFPWRLLHEAGVGHWVEPELAGEGGRGLKPGDAGAEVDALRAQLSLYGYGIAPSGHFDRSMQTVVSAFQRHFRPERVDGIADQSTMRTLERLLAKIAIA